MLSPDKNRLVCEQCGQPMESGASAAGCLNCVLLGGLETDPGATAAPRADTASPGGVAASVRWAYQHYEILRRADGTPWELGRGAMGVTYKALDTNLRVPVALKIIGTRFSAHPEARARFLREARQTARLHHPNVASVHHFGTISPAAGEGVEAGGQTEYFYAMEFIEGETLEARVRRAGVLKPDAALEIALQIAHALAAAERRGMVHRDVKPANIMFTAEGEAALETGMTGDDGEAWVKVIDFGLAKAIKGAIQAAERDAQEQDERDGGPLTEGAFLGTPQFASPEQFAGGEVDVRSDIFSLGVTLWYTLCGELPYDGDSLEEVRDRQLHRPLPVGQLEDAGTPKELVRLLRAMLAPDPVRRPPSAHALCERLRRCLTTVREGGLLGQLKTRRVYRVLLGYAVGAWVLLQMGASALRFWGAPVWAPHLVLVLLVAGMGAAALGGWAVDRRAIGKTLLPRQTARRVAFVAAAMLPSLLVAEYFHLTRARVHPAAKPRPTPAAVSKSR